MSNCVIIKQLKLIFGSNFLSFSVTKGVKLGFVKPENILLKQRPDPGQLVPCLVGVELARSAGVELDKHLVSPVVDVGGGVQGVLPNLVGRGELDVGEGCLDPLLLRPGGEGWTRRHD